MVLDLNPWFIITNLGDPRLWVVLCAAVFVLRLYYKAKVGPENKKFVWATAFIIFAGFAMASSLGISEFVKHELQVPRPCTIETNIYCLGNYSFPSGHATVAFTVFAGIFYIIGKKKHIWIFILPVLVATSRIALGVHTIYDVLGGAGLGILVSIIFLLATKKFKFISKRAGL